MDMNQAVEIFGSKAKISRALGISTAAVAQWGENIPPLRVYQLKELAEKRAQAAQNASK